MDGKGMCMQEIGGYLELDRYNGSMLHEGAVALNCCRNAVAYLIKAKQIKKILLPKFLCCSIKKICEREKVSIRYYSIRNDFLPNEVELEEEEWIYVVNYYGQLENSQLKRLQEKYNRIIIDQAQAYFQRPLPGIDTLYSCRKFIGVPDGAFLYTDIALKENLPLDESFKRMDFLLGRLERNASEFYVKYTENEKLFLHEPIKRMSVLTTNLLHAVDYNYVKDRRTENFEYLNRNFRDINKLILKHSEGSFMYPLYIENGAEIRKRLLEKKVYIPILWPDVFCNCKEGEIEYDMANNILPLPVDQRYGLKEMQYLVEVVNAYLEKMSVYRI